MTELELYKFIKENELPMEWYSDKELVLWLRFDLIKEFIELTDRYYVDGEDVRLLNDDIAINIINLCKCYGIDPESLVTKAEGAKTWRLYR